MVVKVSEQINGQNNTAYNNKFWGDAMYNAPIYGVVPGGSNVTYLLQSLINKAISEGRRAIYFPSGEYYVTALTDDDKVDFFGDNASFVGGYLGTIRQMGDWASNAQLADITLNVMAFGAVGDKVTDDSAAFNAAITFAKSFGIRRILAPKQHLINSTINLTNLLTNGMSIEGNHLSFEYGKGSELLLNTGGIGIDCTGSSRMNFANIKITSRFPGLTNPSTVGVLISRSEVHQFADRCNFYNCSVDMHSNYDENGGVGTIAIYNYAGEIFNIDNCELKGDLPLVFTQNNMYDIQSLITPTRESSPFNTMTTVRVAGSSIMSRKSYACVMENLGEAYFKINTDCYPPLGGQGIADFLMVGDFNKCITIDEIHSELFSKFIELPGKLDEFTITGLKANVTDRVIDMTTSASRLRRGKIKLFNSINRTLYPTGKTSVIYSTANGDFELMALDVTMGSADQIYAPNQRMTSSRIVCYELVADTPITLKANSKYELNCYDGAPSCLITSSVQQTFSTSAFTKLTFNTINLNAGAMYNAGQTDRVTIKYAGLYMVTCSMDIATTMTGVSKLSILQNSIGACTESRQSNANNPNHAITTILRCSVNDIIQAEVWHNNASSILTAANSAKFNIVRIAP